MKKLSIKRESIREREREGERERERGYKWFHTLIIL